MTDPDKAKAEARNWACTVCSAFLSDWDRFSSIVSFMEDGVNAAVRNSDEGKVDSWVAETFAANMDWLRGRLDDCARHPIDALKEAGYGTGRRL